MEMENFSVGYFTEDRILSMFIEDECHRKQGMLYLLGSTFDSLTSMRQDTYSEGPMQFYKNGLN